MRKPRLPDLLKSKIYKTGQTRGADDDVIFQNRVARTSTVLIPYPCWDICRNPPEGEAAYENGYIVLLSPNEYFARADITEQLATQGLTVAENALVFYETREQWRLHPPAGLNWTIATQRQNPLGGQYVRRWKRWLLSGVREAGTEWFIPGFMLVVLVRRSP